MQIGPTSTQPNIQQTQPNPIRPDPTQTEGSSAAQH